MNQDNILAVVAFAGGIEVGLMARNRDYLTPKLNDAIAGKPTLFGTSSRKIGNCYYQYQEVAINYTGADAEKPNGMSGKVNPSREGETDGIKWAYFNYEIDSGG